MKKYIFILLSAFLFSCNSALRFGVSQKYNLDENEKTSKLDKAIVAKYEAIINVDTLNIPLNKFVSTKKYKVYIGVSFACTSTNLFSIYNKKDSFNIIDKTINKTDVSMFFKKGNDFFYSYLYDSEKDKLTYVLTLESDSLLAKEKFDVRFLSKKIME